MVQKILEIDRRINLKERIEEALKVYDSTKSVGETVRILGYPTRRQLYLWINKAGKKTKRKLLPQINNPPDHHGNPPAELKLRISSHKCLICRWK